MSRTLQPPRGTRDFNPDYLRRREWLCELFRAAAKSFAGEEIEASFVERAERFTRKAGDFSRGFSISPPCGQTDEPPNALDTHDGATRQSRLS